MELGKFLMLQGEEIQHIMIQMLGKMSIIGVLMLKANKRHLQNSKTLCTVYESSWRYHLWVIDD